MVRSSLYYLKIGGDTRCDLGMLGDYTTPRGRLMVLPGETLAVKPSWVIAIVLLFLPYFGDNLAQLSSD
jgi:hypothetical protein